MRSVDDRQFELLVNQGLEAMPEEFVEKLKNVAIVIEDEPHPDQLKNTGTGKGMTLFGLYEGIPQYKRVHNPIALPDKISIFKGPLTRAAHNNDHLKRLITNTVWHEIAHHYGLGHGKIHELEREARKKETSHLARVTSLLLDEAQVKHAFYTRYGGVSPAPFDSLNVAHRIGDRPENVEENRRRALTALNLDKNRLVFAGSLAHGKDVFVATKNDAGCEVSGYDAVVTDVADLPIGISAADCVPIVLSDPVKKVIAVVHAGWRGTQVEVVRSAIDVMMSEFDVRSQDILSAIGPSIAGARYEVGSEVAERFDQRYLKSSPSRGKYYLDLWLANADQLKQAGVQHIDVLGIDTCTDERFYSYRREKGTTGRFLAVASI